MALVTKADVKTYMDITLSPLQEDSADVILAGLQSELETYLGRPLEVNTYTDEVHVMGSDHVGVPMGSFFYNYDSSDATSGAWPSIQTFTDPPETVYLRNSPVVTVTSVTRTGASVGATAESLAEHTNYTVRRYGIDVYGSSPNDKIVVTYTAGLAGVSRCSSCSFSERQRGRCRICTTMLSGSRILSRGKLPYRKPVSWKRS